MRLFDKMAAIISQIAANKRARAKNQRASVSSDKCVYLIPPFDPCFNPVVHNKYCRSMYLKKQMEMEKKNGGYIRHITMQSSG